MAKQNATTEETLEKQLWEATGKLRKHIDAAQYKHMVLWLIFLKNISDAFEELYARLKTVEANRADLKAKYEYFNSTECFTGLKGELERSLKKDTELNEQNKYEPFKNKV